MVDELTVLERGMRIRSARGFAGLSRRQLEIKYGISASTLRSWETPRIPDNTGLTQDGAERLISALIEENIVCSLEWLLEGIGAGPQLASNLIKVRDPIHTKPEGETIHKELQSFAEFNPDPIISLITDDGMEPQFGKGSFVAGNRKYNEGIRELLGCFCIVELKEGCTLVRRLTKGNKMDTYTLSCINHSTLVVEPVLYNMTIKSAAKVVWYRTKACPSLPKISPNSLAQ